MTGHACLHGAADCRGYYKMEEMTAAEMDADGFFHTGAAHHMAASLLLLLGSSLASHAELRGCCLGAGGCLMMRCASAGGCLTVTRASVLLQVTSGLSRPWGLCRSSTARRTFSS